MLFKKKISIRSVMIGVVVLGSSITNAEVIFEENFNHQPDWTSTMNTTSQSQKVSTGDVLPVGWDAIYQGTKWSPELGFPGKHASLEILEKNSNKARDGGQGEPKKSAVFWRESYSRGWKSWASDAQLIKLLDHDFKQLYVEFWIRFDNDWYGRKQGQEGPWTSKLFRIGSWSGEGDIFNGAPAGQGDIGPVVFWDYKRDAYGIRDLIAFRGGPHGENYRDGFDWKESESRGFGFSTLHQEVGGADPKLHDQVNGGYLKDVPRYTTIYHDQVFGEGGHWTKMAFFVKMNSAVGVKDGQFSQYINGQRVVHYDNIPWVSDNTENKMVGWNYIAIGGNDYFQAYPNDQRYEDWYSIDDLIIRDDLPSDLDWGGKVSAPNPPPSVNVE